jgi:hypothetical protein
VQREHEWHFSAEPWKDPQVEELVVKVVAMDDIGSLGTQLQQLPGSRISEWFDSAVIIDYTADLGQRLGEEIYSARSFLRKLESRRLV